jgi:hypothetical protein
MDDLFDLDKIRDKWTQKDTGAGIPADPSKKVVNRFALARTHLQTLRQTVELELPDQRELLEPDLLRAETCIFQLFRAPVSDTESDQEPTEFADPPDGDEIREELQAILKRISDLVEIYLVYPRLEDHL